MITNLWGPGELEEVHSVLLIVLHVAQRLLRFGLGGGLLLSLVLLLLVLLFLKMVLLSLLLLLFSKKHEEK